jgi:hypothetical protein
MQVVAEFQEDQVEMGFHQERVVELETFLEAQTQLQVVVGLFVVAEAQQVHLLLVLEVMEVLVIFL